MRRPLEMIRLLLHLGQESVELELVVLLVVIPLHLHPYHQIFFERVFHFVDGLLKHLLFGRDAGRHRDVPGDESVQRHRRIPEIRVDLG